MRLLNLSLCNMQGSIIDLSILGKLHTDLHLLAYVLYMDQCFLLLPRSYTLYSFFNINHFGF